MPYIATQLLQQYGNLAAMLEVCQQEDATKPLIKLRQHQDEARWPRRWCASCKDIVLDSTCGTSATRPSQTKWPNKNAGKCEP